MRVCAAVRLYTLLCVLQFFRRKLSSIPQFLDSAIFDRNSGIRESTQNSPLRFRLSQEGPRTEESIFIEVEF